MKLVISSVLFCIILFSCSDDDSILDNPFLKKIWDTDRFCAFTDLVLYKDIYYCCFRESDGHIPSNSANYGKIRILSSSDGENWESNSVIEDPNFDLRDPKLVVTSDGRLQLLVGCSSFDEKGSLVFRKTKVSFSSGKIDDLKNLNDIVLSDISSPRWLWRSVWKDNVAYGIAYYGGYNPLLMKSTDGITYEKIVEFDLSTTTNEAGIAFRENGNMVVAIRNNSQPGFIGESSYPYTKWSWGRTDIIIHSPDLFFFDDNIFMAFRDYSNKGVRLRINRPNQGLLMSDLFFIPIQGDMGYPGLVVNNDRLLMSFYYNGDIYVLRSQSWE